MAEERTLCMVFVRRGTQVVLCEEQWMKPGDMRIYGLSVTAEQAKVLGDPVLSQDLAAAVGMSALTSPARWAG